MHKLLAASAAALAIASTGAVLALVPSSTDAQTRVPPVSGYSWSHDSRIPTAPAPATGRPDHSWSHDSRIPTASAPTAGRTDEARVAHVWATSWAGERLLGRGLVVPPAGEDVPADQQAEASMRQECPRALRSSLG
ncbi:MAG: hypothetical protein MUD13_04810 [Candidatus Nanopelagicales bacterium]|jgi:hypothetical protein|nr:hypothetical protein [Candidatus Nanopelagicales bacterium]